MSKLDDPKQMAAKTLAAQKAAVRRPARTKAIAEIPAVAAGGQVKGADASKAVVPPEPEPAATPVSKAATLPPPLPEPAKEKGKKVKLVRDSFTMPESEYEVLGQIKKQCLKAGFEIKKSELLRIGVGLVSQMDAVDLQNLLGALPKLKAGRPKKA